MLWVSCELPEELAVTKCEKDTRMKLRVKGNSLRLRVSPSEVTRLIEDGRIEETIYFGEKDDSKLTYSLEHSPRLLGISMEYRLHEVAVVVATEEANRWAGSEQVGIYGETGAIHRVELSVEKDFACLDRDEEENADTFPNPKQGAAC
jgi:hypothetical protein